MSLPPYVLIRVTVEDLKRLKNFVLVAVGRAVAHIVQHLVPDFFTRVFGQLKNSSPEFGYVTVNAARAHLLSGPEPHGFVLTLGQLDQLIHVVSVQCVELLL